MTEPLKPVSLQKYHGVQIDENNVKKAYVDEKTKNMVIEFKTGETLSFPKQDESNNAEVKVLNYCNTFDNRLTNSTRSDFSITDCMGAKFSSSKENISEVNLYGCKDCEVDLAANNSKLFADRAFVVGGENNKVKLDARDKACINNNYVKGEGTAAQNEYTKGTDGIHSLLNSDWDF